MRIPSHPDLERLLLGGAITYAGQMDVLRGTIGPEDFTSESHRTVWHQVCELYDSGQQIDRITLIHALKAKGQLVSSGPLSIEWVARLDDGIPELPHLESYVERVREATTRRRMIDLATQLAEAAGDPGQSADELLSRFSNAAATLACASDPKRQPFSTRDMLEREGADSFTKPRSATGLQLPWHRLNEALCGLNPGQMVVLMAETSRGKTSLALQIAARAAASGYPPVIWTMEMPPRALFQRMITQIGGAPATSRQTTFEQREAQRIAIAQLNDCPVYFDSHSRTIGSFAASLRQVRAKAELGLGVVDYLQRIPSTGTKNRAQEVSGYSRALKDTAMELGIPLLVLSQVDRGSLKNGGEISLHSAKESGDVENDADVVLWIKAGELSREHPTTVSLHVGKQREGPAGFSIPMVFSPLSQAFQEVLSDYD